MANSEILRYRISVPEEDTSVIDWLESQMNMSMSIRYLIKEDIRHHGYMDVTCRSPDDDDDVVRKPSKKRGRRRNKPQRASGVVVSTADDEKSQQDVQNGPKTPHSDAAGAAQETVVEIPKVEEAPVRSTPQESAAPVEEKPAPPPLPFRSKPVVERKSNDVMSILSGGSSPKPSGGNRPLSAAALGILGDD